MADEDEWCGPGRCCATCTHHLFRQGNTAPVTILAWWWETPFVLDILWGRHVVSAATDLLNYWISVIVTTLRTKLGILFWQRFFRLARIFQIFMTVVICFQSLPAFILTALKSVNTLEIFFWKFNLLLLKVLQCIYSACCRKIVLQYFFYKFILCILYPQFLLGFCVFGISKITALKNGWKMWHFMEL
jgi:hypothetical protein